MTSESKSSSKLPYIILIILLVGSNGLFAWLYMEEKNNYEVAIEEKGILDDQKREVEAELEDMILQYEDMKSENDTMNAKISEQQAKIEELITKAKNNRWTIHKLRKEAETLRGIMKSYLKTIDSLNTANIELQAQNEQITEELGVEKTRTSKLSKANEELAEKVKIGEKLEAFDLVSSALRKKNNNLYRETTRSKRANRLKTCFTLDANELTKPGKKWVYARIIGPNGKVVVLEESEENMFEYDGVKALYTVKKEVDYKNEELDVCLYWDVKDQLGPGNYEAYIYAEDYELGKTSFELK